MSSLDEIRAKLAKSQGDKAPSSTSSGDIYPFWNAPNDSTTIVRFLPDADENNTFFWRERQMIRIPFASVEGHPELSNVVVEVPCVEMYKEGDKCPILTETRPWWKTDKEELARRYWPAKTYIYQGFVREGHIDEESPENPIRRFVVAKSIHKIIEASLLDPEMENLPTNFDHGTDFKITKKKDGQYASYATSGFARRESSLTVEERDAVDKFGLFDLSGFLPRKPTQEDLNVIYAMFEESLKEGDSVYRLEWANKYRPKNTKLDLGNAAVGTGTSTPTPTPSAAPAQESAQSAPAQEPKEEAPAASSGGTDDVLAQLRAKMNKG